MLWKKKKTHPASRAWELFWLLYFNVPLSHLRPPTPQSLQAKLTFSSKEIVALSCAWCKASYHNKEACFNPERIGEECTLGTHRSIVVPPSWIVKLPRKGNFKSSLRKTPQKKKSKAGKKVSIPREPRTFVIKPIPTANLTPVLVFINPKSGGNQGAKLLQKFQWLLNPRQVFDLTQGGPRMGWVRRSDYVSRVISTKLMLFFSLPSQAWAVPQSTTAAYTRVRRWRYRRLGAVRARSD